MPIHRPIHAPLLRPVYPPIAGPGLPWEGAGGGVKPYDPINDVDLDLFEHWTARSGLTLSGALATSQLGRKNGYVLSASGAARPTYSATAITDIDGGTHAGLVFAGAQGQSCNDAGLKAAINGRTSLTAIVGLQADQAHLADLQVVLEYGSSFSIGAGEWIVATNFSNPGGLGTGVGYGGAGYIETKTGECPFADPGVLQITLGVAVWGSTSRTLDGVEMLDNASTHIAVSATVPTIFGSFTLHVGSRTESTFFLHGAISDILICGSPTAAAARRARAYVGAQIGAPQG